jgi:hypothetical protein
MCVNFNQWKHSPIYESFLYKIFTKKHYKYKKVAKMIVMVTKKKKKIEAS